MSYFPETKRNFKVENIYNGSRDGWHKEVFIEKVFNKGPTLIILKTSEGAICGGYTSKNWDGIGKYTDDIDAFVFNMTHTSTYPMTGRMLLTLSQMDSDSVVRYLQLNQTKNSINTIRDTAEQVVIDITTSKGMCHHSPIRMKTSHVLN
jgi:hypothetical protein